MTRVKKIISKLGCFALALMMTLAYMLPGSITNVSAFGGGLSQYPTFYPIHEVTWSEGAGFGTSVPAYEEGGQTYYQDGSIVEVAIKLPTNNKCVALMDFIEYNPTQVELLSSYVQIGQSQDSYYSTNGWSAYVVGDDADTETKKTIKYVNDVQYRVPDEHTDPNVKIAKIYFKIKSGVTTDAGTNIQFKFPSWQAADANADFLTPGFDPANSAGTYETSCQPVTIKAKNPSITFEASNGFIKQSDAKAINTANDLKPYNNVKCQLGDGTAVNTTATTPNLGSIKAGTLGNYSVSYSYNENGITDTKTVNLTVVEDDVVISPDGKHALKAKNGILTQDEAKALASTNSLIAVNSASVSVNDGTTATPAVSCPQFATLKSGTVGDYPVTYSYGTGTSAVTKTVNVAVVPNGSVISPNKDFALYAKNGSIKESEAKALTAKDSLRTYNDAKVYLASGGTTNPNTSVSSSNWAEIKSGTHSTYPVYYSYGSGTNETEKEVKITVVGDGDVISPDGKYSLAADDIKLTSSEAKELNSKSDLIDLAHALVTDLDTGSTTKPNVTVNNFATIQDGTVGTYNVTFSYGTGTSEVTKTVKLTVEKDPKNEVTASNASITQTDAKKLSGLDALIAINNAYVTAVDGTHPQPTVTTADYASIKAGIVGSYDVTYSYGSGSKLGATTVKVNVVKDGSDINEDGSLFAKNALIKQSEAKALVNRTDLAKYTDALVTLNDGTHPEPTVTINSADWADLRDGTLGKYDVTYTYTTAHGTLTKSVNVVVVEDDSNISKDRTAAVKAKDGFIKSSQAMNLSGKEDVITYNSASVTLDDGSTATPTVTISNADWLEIKKGTIGSYTVLYSYGSGDGAVEKSAKLTVIDDNSIISPDGKTALTAKDGEISNDEAKKLTNKNDLIPYNEAVVTLADGTVTKPEVAISTSAFDSIKNGDLGVKNVTYTYGTGTSAVSKTVKLDVVQKTKDALMFDYNNNGVIDISDKVQFNYYITTPTAVDETALLLSDSNNNGKIEVSDKTNLNYYLTNPGMTPPIVKIPV